MSILDVIKRSNDMMPEGYKGMSRKDMETRVAAIKKKFGRRLFIPGHHYQKDEVIQFADQTGDSLQLAQIAEKNKEADYIVFCGVHFMAETADMLTGKEQTVILPDMRAGCSMADMADMQQTNRAWEKLQHIFGDTIIPLTYVNSTAEIKAFVGKHGGATVTSSNAKKVLTWAFTQKKRILFLPDQHLGRNTAYDLDIALKDMAVWDPIKDELVAESEHKNVKVILWKGHCSVHEKFTAKNIQDVRDRDPDIRIIVHPECSHEVVTLSDDSGSTKYIIDTINQAPAGSKWAIGTEMNLVQRIIHDHPDKQIESLNPDMCPCLTMNRIDLPHLLWSLDQIDKGEPSGVIKVPKAIQQDALLALNRMLSIT
ncbi:quinolinate synthase NadA [Bacillus spizizenii]|uniref:quinolinate synthase NadA n=1 Tax=Bacillus spizizenii TaxID=96241 RepID=UPI002281702C|nr:quinolinate synthase NadA [Bacillus spizizenii]MCY7796759.1 quinolinate synthase NadA [Bacillus spizizenii]MCY7804293.1 quinolinate synthase NadA [Bacillus spizizenii]MCY7897965.1 quinolinate synthase NadA [Bacillus spizizenii]MCY8210199.1 quinolinate synthase NadA [Bacillus spizizenii]MEC3798473.1 quinolinate synthase NadA [Bacillus spizizenii]